MHMMIFHFISFNYIDTHIFMERFVNTKKRCIRGGNCILLSDDM